ncbi:unnamed protein product [Rhizopus stolonifer]
MLGLDYADKTAILYGLKLGEIVTTVLTSGFQDAHSIKFAVDSSNRDRILEARNELHRLLKEDELGGLPLLIIGNKQDLPNVMDIDEIIKRLELDSICNRLWSIKLSRIGREEKCKFPPERNIISLSFFLDKDLYISLEWLSINMKIEKEQQISLFNYVAQEPPKNCVPLLLYLRLVQ